MFFKRVTKDNLPLIYLTTDLRMVLIFTMRHVWIFINKRIHAEDADAAL